MSYSNFIKAALTDKNVLESAQFIRDSLTVKGANFVSEIQAQMYGGSIDEGLKLIKTHTDDDGGKVAKVYKDSEWGEYRVKHYEDGKHMSKADYHTDDLDDAHGTAKQWLKK